VQFLRRISTTRLLALCAAALVVVAGGTAIALAATSGGPVPPKKPLAAAVHDAIAAPELAGVTARISFKNNLLSGVDLRGSNPILSGADGRLWATNDGHFRLELQSSGGGGDAQIVSDGKSFWAYDGSSNTVYRGTVPQDRHHRHAQDRTPSVSQIQQRIDKVMQHATVSGPKPGNTAGKPSYTVKTSPKKNGGLLGALELAWDANNGAPLKAAIYARGSSSPVLELKATDISFGPVDSSVFHVNPPAGAKTQNVAPRGENKAHPSNKPVTGLANVHKHAGFQVAAPDSLAGRSRESVALLGKGRGALVTYGRGLNGIAVIEKSGAASQDNGPLDHTQLPTVSINGTPAQELETPLGTVIRFRRGEVTYLVLGSLPRAAVESAARGL
jgi:outer membrane lipoprotein-sorting protein